MSLLEKYSYRKYRKNKLFRHFISVIAVIISGFLQAFTLKVFIQPSNLLSSGFLGVAILINQISELFGVELSISILLILLNIPVAILCYRGISARFTFYSILQVFVGSFFIRVLNFDPLFVDWWGVKRLICFTRTERKCFNRGNGFHCIICFE